jgi:hypothetical protein
MTAFSQAERGSAYDMVAAVELTERRELRLTYLHHALDEARHARFFRARVQELGRLDRAQAALSDSGSLRAAGILGSETLFERLGELEFLAFVHIVEKDALEQFNVYCDHGQADPKTIEMLRTIGKDEKFHLSYSGRELELYRSAGRGKEVDWALRRVRWRRVWEAWLRFSKDIGDVVSSVWLYLLCLVAVGPFRLFARLEPGGWQASAEDPRAIDAFARSQA